MKLNTHYRQRYPRSGFHPFHLLRQFLSRFLNSRITQIWNSKWPFFLGTIHSKQNNFGNPPCISRPPTRSVPPLYDHGVQVFKSADKAELPAQRFERVHHLDLNAGTTNHGRTVIRTVNKYFRPPNPHLTQSQLTNLYELRLLIKSHKTKSAPGTEVISTDMLRNISNTAHLNF
jgi:hypothetical protein